ncbi:MAG: hypothetical protein K5751_06010 [Treponemataceae bacterium]|nr:hypothetical protein [Treponemataceae bacterium]
MKKGVVFAFFALMTVLLLSSFTGADGKALGDGTYSVDVEFDGGTGKAKILSPAVLVVKDGEAVVTVTWSSKNYDYMIVDGVKYMNLTPGKASSFSFPVAQLGKEMDVIGDSVAMSKPHEIEYKLTFTLAK